MESNANCQYPQNAKRQYPKEICSNSTKCAFPDYINLQVFYAKSSQNHIHHCRAKSELIIEYQDVFTNHKLICNELYKNDVFYPNSTHPTHDYHNKNAQTNQVGIHRLLTYSKSAENPIHMP